MDKKLAAEKIRARLEKRLATFLGCEVGDLPRFKIGTLVHTLFLLLGDSEELGGFHTSMDGVLKILGNEIFLGLSNAAHIRVERCGHRCGCANGYKCFDFLRAQP